jgi:hypothetical protein
VILDDDFDVELRHRFTYHPPRDSAQVVVYQRVRAAGLELAREIAAASPECEERKVALNQVDAAVMWANAAVARHG